MGDYASNDSSCEEAGLCSYELKRLENIRKNQEILKSLGEFSSHNICMIYKSVKRWMEFKITVAGADPGGGHGGPMPPLRD